MSIGVTLLPNTAFERTAAAARGSTTVHASRPNTVSTPTFAAVTAAPFLGFKHTSVLTSIIFSSIS